MAKESILLKYLKKANETYETSTDEEHIRKKAIIDNIIASKKIDESLADYTGLDKSGIQARMKDVADYLGNNDFFEKLDVSDKDVYKIVYGISMDQAKEVANIANKNILVIHPKDKFTTESYEEYEEYLKNKYEKMDKGLLPKTRNITIGSETISIRERYPHEEEAISGIDQIIYNPNSDAATIQATKEYYVKYYENIVADKISRITPTVRNKADFINLLDQIKNDNVYHINKANNFKDIAEEIANELAADNTNQTT